MPKILKRVIRKIRVFLIKRGFDRKETPLYYLDIDLIFYLDSFLKTGEQIANPAAYKIRHTCSLGCYLRRVCGAYVDTEWGFTLIKIEESNNSILRTEIGLASIGFGIYDDCIVISQLQGRAGQQVELKKIRWEKMLVKIVADWAKKNGFKQVTIEPASRNRYFSGREKEFKLRYDVTAERSGFKLDSPNGAYVLDLLHKAT